LEYLINNSNCSELLTALQLLTPRSTVGSLAMNDNFEAAKLHQFLIMRNLECELNTGTEDFPVLIDNSEILIHYMALL
ncbi:8061_t:CDS:2, partial [Racocetra fulgida]